MIISNITPPQVWAASSRSLTNIGSGAVAATPTAQATVAALATINLKPSAGTLAQMTVSVQTGTAATTGMTIQLTDGTNTHNLVTTATGTNQSAGFSAINVNAVGIFVFNGDSAVVGKYMVAQFTWTI